MWRLAKPRGGHGCWSASRLHRRCTSTPSLGIGHKRGSSVEKSSWPSPAPWESPAGTTRTPGRKCPRKCPPTTAVGKVGCSSCNPPWFRKNWEMPKSYWRVRLISWFNDFRPIRLSVRSSSCSRDGRMDFLGRAEFLRKWANLSLSKKRSRRGVFTAALLAATSSLRWLHHGCATKQDRFFPAN